MREVGAFEAKNKLASLLDQVEQGAEIVITKRGRPVAKLVPAQSGFDRDKARRAADDIRALAREMKLGPSSWEEWKRFRDEGRS